MTKDETEFAEQCMRFRNVILKPGGSRAGSNLLADFFREEFNLREIVKKFGVEKV